MGDSIHEFPPREAEKRPALARLRPGFFFSAAHVSSDERAQRLLGQLHQWAMEAVQTPRDQRDGFISDVAARYYDDAVRNGLTETQAAEWRRSVDEWLRALVNVIETSGGAKGGNA